MLVSRFVEFEDAAKAKAKLEGEFPENNYQIRRLSGGFGLFHRFKVNDIKIQQIVNQKKAYKRSKRWRNA